MGFDENGPVCSTHLIWSSEEFFFSLFPYSSFPNLPSFQICWILRLLVLLVTRKVFPSEISYGHGHQQVIFLSRHVQVCLFLLKTRISCNTPPTLQKERETIKPNRHRGFTAADQTSGFCWSSHQGHLDDFRQRRQVPVVPNFLAERRLASGEDVFGRTSGPVLSFLVLKTMLAVFSVFLTSGLLVFQPLVLMAFIRD